MSKHYRHSPPPEEPKLPEAIGKLFGLVPDPKRKFEYKCYFLVTATIGENGQIMKVEKSPQSWLIWEAQHKLERAAQEELIEIMGKKGTA